jgi:hypothetical protein
VLAEALAVCGRQGTVNRVGGACRCRRTRAGRSR